MTELKGRAIACAPALDAIAQVEQWSKLFELESFFPVRAVFACRYWNKSGVWEKICDPFPVEGYDENNLLVEVVFPAVAVSVLLNGQSGLGRSQLEELVTGRGDRVEECTVLPGGEEINFRFKQGTFVQLECEDEPYPRLRRDGKPYRYRGGRGSVLYHLRSPRILSISSEPIWSE